MELCMFNSNIGLEKILFSKLLVNFTRLFQAENEKYFSQEFERNINPKSYFIHGSLQNHTEALF